VKVDQQEPRTGTEVVEVGSLTSCAETRCLLRQAVAEVVEVVLTRTRKTVEAVVLVEEQRVAQEPQESVEVVLVEQVAHKRPVEQREARQQR
jgi:hypothetical protein